MEFHLGYTVSEEFSVDTLVCGLYQESSFGELGLSDLTTRDLEQQAQRFEFKAKKNQLLLLNRPQGLAVERLIVVGLGHEEDSSLPLVRKAVGLAFRRAQKQKASSVALNLESFLAQDSTLFDLITVTVQGALFSQYSFDHYKSDAEKKRVSIDRALLLISYELDMSELEDAIRIGEATASSVLNTRDLVNQPPSAVKPSTMVEAAREIAALSPNITVKVFDKDQLTKENYNALLAVASGSEEPPYLIDLRYTPANSTQKVAFIGKGVTFDSGGLGIKPWAAMQSMKSDMAGAAAVLGIFQALAELEAIGQPLTIEVHGVIPTTENMISGKAMRPDDIIQTRNGKTIEILHTDAEGRLILADGLTYAAESEPDMMIDFATLTGSAIKALGREISAYMGNDDELLDLVAVASQMSGEKAWELPLPDEYHHFIESPVADLQNISNNSLSPDAIIGGLFLKEFADDIAWVHLDIAGPSFADDGKDPLVARGASGYGVLLGLELLKLLSLAEK